MHSLIFIDLKGRYDSRLAFYFDGFFNSGCCRDVPIGNRDILPLCSEGEII